MEADDMSKVGSEIVEKIANVEALGQKIVGTQASIVQLDQQRAKLRESLHALNRSSGDSKTYTAVCPDLFVQYPNDFLRKVIKKDVEQLDTLITETRAELKQNVNTLRQLEGDTDLAELGFNLKSYRGE
jgi:prefoldin subunit 5